MKFLQELKSLHEGAVKGALADAIAATIERLPVALLKQPYEEVVRQIAQKVQEKNPGVDIDLLMDMVKTQFEPDDLTESSDGNWPKLIAHADEFRVEMDEDEQVHILDGEGAVRVSMPLVIWKQLCR